MPGKHNLIGQRFGRYLVLAEAPNQGSNVRWLCRCDCGNLRMVQAGALREGTSTSCGCYSREAKSKTHTKHGCGVQRTPEYLAWVNMKARCRRKTHPGYGRYGGRGIKVCERWLTSFNNFLADMGQRPSEQHSLDRINNNGDYEPGNCRWATIIEQQNNLRSNVPVEFNGAIYSSISALARALGVERSRIGRNKSLRLQTVPEETQ